MAVYDIVGPIIRRSPGAIVLNPVIGWWRLITMAFLIALLLLLAFLAACIIHTRRKNYQKENEEAGYYLLHNERKGRAS